MEEQTVEERLERLEKVGILFDQVDIVADRAGLNKYRMFRNYMANELGVSKEQIEEWTKEAIKEAITAYINRYIATKDFDLIIRKQIEAWIWSNAKPVMADMVREEYQIKLEPTAKKLAREAG